jgi:hypothetical protein
MTPSSATGPVGVSAPDRRLRMLVNATVGLIGLEFLLGVAVNLWVQKLPANLGDLFGPSAGSYSPLLAAHAGLGVLVGLVSLATLILAYGARPRALAVGCGVGFAAVLVAAIGGEGYLASAGQAAYSFVMAVGFLGAFWAYSWVRIALARAAAP